MARPSGSASDAGVVRDDAPRPDVRDDAPRPGVRRRGASDAFSELFVAHAPYVLGLLRRLGVRDAEVEDVAQEVFLVVHRQLPAFEGRSSLRTWICGIAVRTAHNHRRRAYRRREVPAPIAGAPYEPRLPPPQLARVQAVQEAQQLLDALVALSPAQRDVFVLFEIERLPMREVAQLLGCPRFTAYTRLRSARAGVRKHFERHREET